MCTVPDIKLGRYSRSITRIKFSSVRRLYGTPLASRGHERNILSNIMLLTIFTFLSATFQVNFLTTRHDYILEF